MGNTKETLTQLRQEAAKLTTAIPQTMKPFYDLMKSTGADGALDGKTKELMALAIAISVRCEGCILFHVQNAIKHHATREEVAETIAVAVEMSGGPGTVYGAKALAAFDDLQG
jgi:AhpD family alkylhydroperoxidase